LYFNVCESLALSVITLSWVPFLSKVNPVAKYSIREHFTLMFLVVLLPVVLVALLISNVLEIVGVHRCVRAHLDRIFVERAHGFTLTNVRVALGERPDDFLGHLRHGHVCETRQGNTRYVVEMTNDQKSNVYVLQDAAVTSATNSSKAAQLLTARERLPGDSIRAVGAHVGVIAGELAVLASPPQARTFSKEIASVMTRFSATTYEIFALATDDDLGWSSTKFSIMSRYGFSESVAARVVLRDERWPNTFAVVFWSVPDGWITLAFKGAELSDLTTGMSNVSSETVRLRDGGQCHSGMWRALCSERAGAIPFFLISKQLDAIRREGWPSSRSAKPNLFVTGIGFGGSLAELFLYLKLGAPGHFGERAMVGYTFGALGVGDALYCREFDKRGLTYDSGLFRVCNEFDVMVAHPIGLKSAGQRVLLKSPAPGSPLSNFFKTWQEVARANDIPKHVRDLMNGRNRTEALSALVFFLIARPCVPSVSERMPIAYFTNINDGVIVPGTTQY
ncbi:hypothetical protein PBRA_004435, partial [Plasmodiophora brassicae]